MLKRMMYCPIGGHINVEIVPFDHESLLAAAGWLERPLILLVAPIAFVQAPSYLLAHRSIGCCCDSDALLCDDLTTPCLNREVL